MHLWSLIILNKTFTDNSSPICLHNYNILLTESKVSNYKAFASVKMLLFAHSFQLFSTLKPPILLVKLLSWNLVKTVAILTVTHLLNFNSSKKFSNILHSLFLDPVLTLLMLLENDTFIFCELCNVQKTYFGLKNNTVPLYIHICTIYSWI
jgi:hypothetical protein